jgi:hypothetical protein
VKVVRTRHGVRIVQHGLVLSEIRTTPGPTDSLFDVLAATIAALAPGPDVAVLGFAGGGLVAPLRAMGFGHPLQAVDLSLAHEALFREHSGPWAGEVVVHEAEATRWLRARRRPFDLVLEDLSTEAGGDVTKPSVSLAVLPALMREKVGPRGVVVTNVLPVPGLAWRDLLGDLAKPWRVRGARRLVVHLEDWENRVLLCGALPTARATSRTLKRHLRALGSDQADGLSVRTL